MLSTFTFTPNHIKNSSDLPTFINTQQLGEEILVSFDVVSLFTKVPIELAIFVARERLQEDNTLEDRTALSINDIIQLLEFCLKATYFSFRGQYLSTDFWNCYGFPRVRDCSRYGDGEYITKGLNFLFTPSYFLEKVCRRHLCRLTTFNG